MMSLVTVKNIPSTPKVEYFKFSPTSTRYYRVMSLAASLGCSWQDVIREAIDFYLKYYSLKKV